MVAELGMELEASWLDSPNCQLKCLGIPWDEEGRCLDPPHSRSPGEGARWAWCPLLLPLSLGGPHPAPAAASTRPAAVTQLSCSSAALLAGGCLFLSQCVTLPLCCDTVTPSAQEHPWWPP